MKIETKFSIGDTVWFIFDNNVSHLDITAVSISVYESGDPVIKYTLHFNHDIDESKVFATKEELLKSL